MNLNLFLGIFLSCAIFSAAKMNICVPTFDTAFLEDGVADFKLEQINMSDIPKTMEIPRLKFNFHHPAIAANGIFEDMTLSDYLDFEFCTWSDPGKKTQIPAIIFNLTFLNTKIVTKYNLTGNFGDGFIDIFGKGTLDLFLKNFSVSSNFTLKPDNIKQQNICLDDLNINLDLESSTIKFTGFMDDNELNDLFSNVFTELSPEALRVIWDENRERVDPILEKLIDIILKLKDLRKFMEYSQFMLLMDPKWKKCYVSSTDNYVYPKWKKCYVSSTDNYV